MNVIPKLGSKWVHHNGLKYTVILIANTGNCNDNPKYPVTVIYKGNNDKVWAKSLKNFWETLSPSTENLRNVPSVGEEK